MVDVEKLKRAKFYTMHGHKNIAIIPQILTWVMLWYYIFISTVSFLGKIFPNFIIWIMFITPSYLLLAMYIGRKDINKDLLGWQTEGEVALKKNPIWIKLFEKLEEIEERLE